MIERQKVLDGLPRRRNGKPAVLMFVLDGRDASGDPWDCIHHSSKGVSHMLRDSITLATRVREEEDLVRMFGDLRQEVVERGEQ